MLELALVTLLLAPASPAPPEPALWTDDGSVLEVPLAHRERDRVDAGVLRLDRRRRVLTWQGLDEAIGCRLRLEVPLADVAGVAESRGPGLTLTLRSGAVRELTLIPPAHFALLLQAAVRPRGGISREEAIASGLRNDDVYADATGSGAFKGPSSRTIAVPEAARRDVRAVIGVLRAVTTSDPPTPND
jgi:hypothetical protein